MLKNYTYKVKFRFLLLACLLALILVYYAAVKPTVNLVKEYKVTTSYINTMQDAPLQIQQLEAQLKASSFLFGDGNSPAGNHEYLHETVSKFCSENNIRFSGFPPAHFFVENDYTVRTNMVEAEGHYNNLLRLMKHLETDFQYGRVVSARFHALNDIRAKKRKLYMQVYIQTIINNAEEK